MIHKIHFPKPPLSQFVENLWMVEGAIAVVGVFESKSWTYILINGGYMTVAFVIMGAILGAWR